MAEISCANCGEDTELLGERTGPNNENITVTCQSCGLMWDRDFTPRCETCGQTDVYAAFQAILDKSRGTQLSIQSMKLVYLCPVCQPDLHATYSQTNTPIPPDHLPVETDD